MKVKKLPLLFGFAVIVTLAVLGLTASYAWYVHSVNESAYGKMGEVIIGINEPVEVSEKGLADFEVSNDSTIDIYMRLGWTPVYKDRYGREAVADITGIEVVDAMLSESYSDDSLLNGSMPVAGEVTALNGYIKKMITLENKTGKYLVVPAGTNVKGQIKLNTVNNPDSDKKLYIVFVPEALQATRKAVAAAAAYGWDETKVDGQARSVVAVERGEE